MSKFEKEQVFQMPSVLIAGYGIVGKHIKKEFPFWLTDANLHLLHPMIFFGNYFWFHNVYIWGIK